MGNLHLINEKNEKKKIVLDIEPDEISPNIAIEKKFKERELNNNYNDNTRDSYPSRQRKPKKNDDSDLQIQKEESEVTKKKESQDFDEVDQRIIEDLKRITEPKVEQVPSPVPEKRDFPKQKKKKVYLSEYIGNSYFPKEALNYSSSLNNTLQANEKESVSKTSVDTDTVFEKIACSEDSIAHWTNRITVLQENEDLIRYALSKERKDLKTKENLLDFIRNSPGNNQCEKVWMIYLWITKNISNIFEASKEDSSIRGRDPFEEGEASSEGFAALTAELCLEAGILCKIVCGYGKGHRYKVGQKFEGLPYNHAWNIVFIGKKWRFIDTCWGEGYRNSDSKPIKSFDPYWFLTPPEIFVYKHFPKSQEDQLLDYPVTLEEFENLPGFENSFFRLGFKMVKNECLTIKEEKNPFVIEIDSSSEGENSILVDVYKCLASSTEKIEEAVLIQKKTRETFEINVAVPRGKYTLTIFGNQGETITYTKLVDFIVESTSEENQDFLWCEAFESFENQYLFYPKSRRLIVGEKARFKLKVKATKVYLKNKESLSYFEQTGDDNWELEEIIKVKGRHKIMANNDGTEAYCTLFSYVAE